MTDVAFYRNDGVWTGHLYIPESVERMEYNYEIKHFGFEKLRAGHRIYFLTRKRFDCCLFLKV